MVCGAPKDVDEPMQLDDKIEQKKVDVDEAMDIDDGVPTRLGPENQPAKPATIDTQQSKPDELAQTQPAKSPQQIYADQVSSLKDAALKEKLMSLYEFGFVSFQTNKFLLEKYKDLETVINMLISG